MPFVNESTLESMKSVRRWVVWKYGPKPKGKKARKLPFYVNGQPRRKPLDVESDWKQLASHEEATARCKANPGFMLGFALGPDGSGGHWQGLDFDGTLGGASELPGYVEKSPSATGYHSTGYGRHFYAYTEEFEAYSSGRFLTFTGDFINDGPLHDFADFVNTHHGKLEEHVAAIQLEVSNFSVDQLLDAMSVIPNDDIDWNAWTVIGMALWAAVGEGKRDRGRALAAWVAFSAKSEKFDVDEVLKRWDGITRSPPSSVGAGTIIYRARKAGWKVSKIEGKDGGPLIEDALGYVPGAKPLAPMEFVIENFVRTGLYAFYGPYNAGKTTGLIALCLFVAGLLNVPGLPRSLRRKVFYIAEDPEQIINLIEGYFSNGMLSGDFKEWFHIIPSKRRPSAYWSKKIQSVVGDDGRAWGGPLVVFDTASSNMDIEDISNNSRVGEFIAALKEASRSDLSQVSVWIVMHVAKALRDATADELSALGAQAWGADTFGEVKFTIEGENYCVTLGKKRFEIDPINGVAVECYRIVSEKLEPVELATAWASEYPAMAVQRRSLRIVKEFEPVTKEQVRDERKAKNVSMSWKRMSEKLAGLLSEAWRAKPRGPGVCIWAVGGKRNEPSLELCGGYRFVSFRALNDGRDVRSGDEADELREDLARHFGGERKGDLYFFKSGDLYSIGLHRS